MRAPFSFQLLLPILTASLACAQYYSVPAAADASSSVVASASPDPASTASSAAPAATQTVVVGGAAGLVYTPSTVNVALGTVVLFEFHAKTHSVTQSSFAQPCVAIEISSNGTTQGFDSGLQPVPPNATTFPTFSVTVNDTRPVWAHCSQQGPPIHCHEGMVFAINPPPSGPNTYDAFRQLAMAQGNQTSAGNSTTGSGTGSSSGSSPASSTPSTKANGAGRIAASTVLSLSIIGVSAAVFL